MADLGIQKSKVVGADFVPVAAGGSGDTVPIGAKLFVRNGDASSKTITVVVPGTQYGQARPDITKAVAAGEYAIFGPFPADLADPSDGKVHITYSATTSVLVAAID